MDVEVDPFHRQDEEPDDQEALHRARPPRTPARAQGRHGADTGQAEGQRERRIEAGEAGGEAGERGQHGEAGDDRHQRSGAGARRAKPEESGERRAGQGQEDSVGQDGQHQTGCIEEAVVHHGPQPEPARCGPVRRPRGLRAVAVAKVDQFDVKKRFRVGRPSPRCEERS